jgi:hypothetical protein
MYGEFDGLRAILGDASGRPVPPGATPHLIQPARDAESPEPVESAGLTLDPNLEESVADESRPTMARVSPRLDGLDAFESELRKSPAPRSEELEDSEGQPRAASLEDDPSLLELDHGVYDGDSRSDTAVRPRSREVLRRVVAAGAQPEPSNGSLESEGLEDLFVESGASASVDESNRIDTDRGEYEPKRPINPGPNRQLPAERQAGVELRERNSASSINSWMPAVVVVLGMLFGASAALLTFHKQVSQIVAQWG